MDPFTQYAMIVADEAVNDSGILETKFTPEDIGVIWGSGIGGLKSWNKKLVTSQMATVLQGLIHSLYLK